MKPYTSLRILLIAACYVFFCCGKTMAQTQPATSMVERINLLSSKWSKDLVDETTDDLMSIYDHGAIYMPEYQPTLNGSTKIRDYFDAMNKKRKVLRVDMRTKELLKLEDYILQIGTFEMDVEWRAIKPDAEQNFTGKYWRIWKRGGADELSVVGEAFGFYKRLDHPERWVTDMATRKDPSPSGFEPHQASIELKAYHAIGQQGVKQRNGALRSELYAQDAIFYPFADTPKKGIGVLKPYLIKYSSHGAIIDSVQTHTHEVIYLRNYILEFAKFAVAWRYNEMPGQSNGKGISLRKRLDNGELRFFRHIGTHNLEL